MAIVTLKEASKVSRLMLINYGPSGGGKTIKSCGARRWGKVYIADFDLKAEGLKQYFEKIDPKALDLIDYETFVDDDLMQPNAKTAIEKLFATLSMFAVQAKEGKLPYATFVLDTFTSFQDAYLAHIVARNPKSSREKMTHKLSAEMNVVFPALEDYRVHKFAQMEFFKKLVRLPLNIILNFHDDIRQDEDTGTIERGILASGALQKVFPTYFNEVHRVNKRGPVWASQIQHDGMWPSNTKLTVKDTYIPSDLSVYDGIAYKTSL